MATEIERKFTVINEDWRELVSHSKIYRQGYMSNNEQASVRVRIEDESANLNIKSATLGIERMEYEYDIPKHEAEEMLEHLCAKPLIEKTRHFVTYEGKIWEVDVFEGDNQGLVVAEVELNDANEPIALPSWVGEDVSHDKRYYNVCLVTHPYKDWDNK